MRRFIKGFNHANCDSALIIVKDVINKLNKLTIEGIEDKFNVGKFTQQLQKLVNLMIETIIQSYSGI